MSAKATVFVSGATGYIALHVVDNLLKEGYSVIGSVRSQEKADHILKEFSNDCNLTLEIVPDISALDAFDDVFKRHGKDIKVVIHTASPVVFDPKDLDKDLLIPAINGTKSILESIKKYAADTVENVVITSSLAAQRKPSETNDSTVTIDENSWNNITMEEAHECVRNAYSASKVFAEKAAWEFLKNNADVVKFKLTTVMPGFVFGPQTFVDRSKSKFNHTIEIVRAIANAKTEDELYQCSGTYVDVRDVARAHLLAFQKKECAGERLSLSTSMFCTQSILNVINEDFPQLKGKITEGDPASENETLDNMMSFNNDKTKKLLGFDFIPLRKSIDDTVNQLFEFGAINV
ncbi:hypothetical protein NCAS_0A03400 [Naumovozyma castellii]|uniref:NAD-dependent epimerase/dehydratase domain-containing protein n=1 Tax=Naumovozyma castellii TaxID=27288 RepID=G0V608_NAUCA|nr:hypothetical protein NCAS_0A03400 [Naumovozyma castellii CBS 4309]CCC66898.1 hypothetical protein NCAS_0A03400 [Naumovozyma castellii CBS 4309]